MQANKTLIHDPHLNRRDNLLSTSCIEEARKENTRSCGFYWRQYGRRKLFAITPDFEMLGLLLKPNFS